MMAVAVGGGSGSGGDDANRRRGHAFLIEPFLTIDISTAFEDAQLQLLFMPRAMVQLAPLLVLGMQGVEPYMDSAVHPIASSCTRDARIAYEVERLAKDRKYRFVVKRMMKAHQRQGDEVHFPPYRCSLFGDRAQFALISHCSTG